MRVATETFWLPKAGNSEEEYEDAYWPEGDTRGRFISEDIECFRCAIADGATEASFSGSWAQLLCRQYCHEAEDSGPSLARPSLHSRRFLTTIPHLQRQWQQEIDAKPLPWFAEEKARSGAFASLLGLSIYQVGGPEELKWEALAVGDSCLFQVRDYRFHLCFPLCSSQEFNNSPYLLDSKKPVNEASLGSHLHLRSDECRPGDIFYLMTDALACWFLHGYEMNRNTCIEWIENSRTPEQFQMMVNDERKMSGASQQPHLKNDDVTLLRLEIQS